MDIGRGINLCSKLIKNKMNKELEDYKITSVQFSVLKFIETHNDEAGYNTAANISQMLDMDKPTISAVINRLIEKDYIEKRAHPTDGRAWVLSLTDRYKENSAIMEEKSAEVINLAVLGLNPEEVMSLNKMLSKIIGNLKDFH